ncbi:MAG: DUF5696 domain-containing protein [Anaerolineae bacterium]|nr:DUF5696 domain-containing protein [Anaerolineae bacterium]
MASETCNTKPAVIENEHLRVALGRRGSPILTDKVSGIEWRPFENGPGPQVALTDPSDQELIIDLESCSRLQVNQLGANRLQVTYTGLSTGEQELDGFRLEILLALATDGASLEMLISSLTLEDGMKLERLCYPNHHLSLRTTYDDGYLVVPTKQGVIVPTRFEVGYMRFQHNTWAKIADQEHTLAYDTGSLNMPWYGAVVRQDERQSAILCYAETSADTALTVLCNKVVPTPELFQPEDETSQGVRLCSLTPVWRGSHGQLGYARKLRIEVIPGGDYVDLAKRYREFSIDSGRYRSLRDKIAENPAVERLIGAPDIKIYNYTNRPKKPFYRSRSEPVLSGYERVHTTFSQVADIARELHDELKIDRALILLGGWIRAGYDREHPDVWPPAEKAGGTDGMREASRAIVDHGYVCALHDNYQDMYPDAPSYDPGLVMRDRNGDIKQGMVWDGGQCELICSSKGIELATPTVREVSSNTMTNGYYLDTTTAARLYECYSQAHPLTRGQDREEKLKLLQWLQVQGFVVGGEAGTDWGVRACSFFEGLPGSSVGFFDGITGPLFGIATPLFSLVYHDAVVSYWQHGQPFGREDHDNHFLSDLLSANPSSWVLVKEQWDDLKPLIKESADMLGQLHRRTAHQQMISHSFISEDFAVQESSFEDGTHVVVNFGITSFSTDSCLIAPKGFLIENPDGSKVQGVMNRHCEITRVQLAVGDNSGQF